jgi:hypothetical protein
MRIAATSSTFGRQQLVEVLLHSNLWRQAVKELEHGLLRPAIRKRLRKVLLDALLDNVQRVVVLQVQIPAHFVQNARSNVRFEFCAGGSSRNSRRGSCTQDTKK